MRYGGRGRIGFWFLGEIDFRLGFAKVGELVGYFWTGVFSRIVCLTG